MIASNTTIAMMIEVITVLRPSSHQKPGRQQRKLLDRAGAHLGVRQRVEKLLAVFLGQQPLVEHRHDATILLRADQPPEALLEAQDRLRHAELVEWVDRKSTR